MELTGLTHFLSLWLGVSKGTLPVVDLFFHMYCGVDRTGAFLITVVGGK